MELHEYTRQRAQELYNMTEGPVGTDEGPSPYEETLRQRSRRPVLAVDLDGTVRHGPDGGFINSPEDVTLYDGVEEQLHAYRELGFFIAAHSNQGGIAFGYKDTTGFYEEVDRMMVLFDESPIDIYVFESAHPEGTIPQHCYRSLRRKPSPGMLVTIEEGMLRRNVIPEWDRSLVVGDRHEDKDMAATADVPFRWAWRFFGRERPSDGSGV